MRRFAAFALVLTACIHHSQPRPIEGPALGRVVIYRNGVAFYERRASVVDGKLSVRVPRERVDDFLKSLTVVDPTTRKPLAVSIPRTERDDGSGRESYLTMTLETGDRRPSDVLLTYITEAPAWKPSYRAVIGGNGKVMLEGWAVVDNMSGEDWKGVLVGVGASSALSFRYDLWSLRHIDRDLLQRDETFAAAPPTGLSPYGASNSEELGQLDASDGITVDKEYLKNIPVPGRTFETALGAAAGSQGDGAGVSFSGSTSLENQYYVDGVNTTGLTYGTTISGGGGSAPEPPPTGTLSGYVKDKKSSYGMAGVTVVAQPSKGDPVTAITDDKGYYQIVGAPAGKYAVTFYYGDLSVQRDNVKVDKNRTVAVNQSLDETKAGGETIALHDSAPTVDTTSRTTGVEVKPAPTDARIHAIASKVLASKRDVLLEAHGDDAREATARAQKAQQKLVDMGVPAKRIHVATKIGPSEGSALKVLAVAGNGAPESHAPPTARTGGPDTPVGESHFMAERPMTVRNGTSAMVAMVHGETDGGVVYFYDPISDRGDKKYAFKAMRLVNPTADTLEPGPITVYGDGRFIGEGVTEPVPPHASVVVPFALDRQIVVTRTDHEEDQIAKLVSVQRGVVTAEVQHRREARFIVTSRLGEPTTVYLRHRLESGWTLAESPSESLHVGDSQLFRVQLGAGETKYVTIAEATPVERSLDLSSDETLGMMKVFIEEPQASPKLKEQIQALLAMHHSAADITDKISTLREQLADIQAREGELHAQIVTLRAVRAGGELLAALRKKLEDMSERAQKTTIAIVDAQEQLMLTKVKFQNQLSELHLTDAAAITKR